MQTPKFNSYPKCFPRALKMPIPLEFLNFSASKNVGRLYLNPLNIVLLQCDPWSAGRV